ISYFFFTINKCKFVAFGCIIATFAIMLQLRIASFLFLLTMAFSGTAQAEEVPCDFVIKGVVIDEHDNSELDYANVFIVELLKGAMADSLGYFEIKGICPGKYTFRIS